VRYARIPYTVNQSAANDVLARKMAQASIVLLKNDGVLPLKKDLKTLAVIGPTADDVMTLLANYYGRPASPVTALAGIRKAVSPGTRVVYARGVDLVEGREDPRAVPVIDAARLRPAAGSSEKGLRGEYFRGRELAGEPLLTRTDPGVAFRWERGSPTSDGVARGEIAPDRAVPDDDFSARWTGQLLAPATGRYEISVTADDGFRLDVDGKRVLDEWTVSPRSRAKSVALDLEAGRAYDLKLEYFDALRDAEVRLAWTAPRQESPFDEAVAAARSADAVVFLGGLTADVEGEEMRVSYPGFAGGDRTDIALPAPQERLLKAVHATGKPVVLVLTTGSALGVEWAKQNLPGIVVAWYPGQQGGTALADVLFGDVSPSGRLPVTFYKSAAQLPPFEDYAMAGRTYRYFSGEPLYPFGYGLSYSRFSYANLQLDRASARAADRVTASVDVTNAGTRAAHEVVQLYAHATQPKDGDPRKELRGFTRVFLKPGEKRRVTFALVPAKDLARYDVAKTAFTVAPGSYEIQVGASSEDLRLTRTLRVE